MPRIEKRMVFDKQEIKRILEARHKMKITHISFDGDNIFCELEE